MIFAVRWKGKDLEQLLETFVISTIGAKMTDAKKLIENWPGTTSGGTMKEIQLTMTKSPEGR